MTFGSTFFQAGGDPNPTGSQYYEVGKSNPNAGAGAGGANAKGVGQGSPEAPALAATPSPLVDPLLWIQVGIGSFTFPLQRGQGTAFVEPDSLQKLDEQKASGKSKAKMKQSGVDPCPIEVDLRFRATAWPVVEAMLNGIDPNGAGKGGPFEFKHPDANRRGVKSVMVKKVGAVKWQPGGWIGTCRISLIEWEIPKKAAAGVGTKTPKKATEWYDTANQSTKVGANGNVGGQWQGGDQQPKVNPDGTVTLTKSSTGFDGPGAPNASP